MALGYRSLPVANMNPSSLQQEQVRKVCRLSPPAWKSQPISLLSRHREDLPAPVGPLNHKSEASSFLPLLSNAIVVFQPVQEDKEKNKPNQTEVV